MSTAWLADGIETVVTYALRVEPAIALPGYLKRHVERSIVETALEGLRARVEVATGHSDDPEPRR